MRKFSNLLAVLASARFLKAFPERAQTYGVRPLILHLANKMIKIDK